MRLKTILAAAVVVCVMSALGQADIHAYVLGAAGRSAGSGLHLSFNGKGGRELRVRGSFLREISVASAVRPWKTS